MIYLDAAATTLEKPPQVRQAMAQAAAERNYAAAIRRLQDAQVEPVKIVRR